MKPKHLKTGYLLVPMRAENEVGSDC